MNHLVLKNRQRTRRIDMAMLRSIARGFLETLPEVEEHELAVHLLCDDEMASMNETFLNHLGPTDVITFDLSESKSHRRLHGEIFICVDEAVRNARRFRTTWQKEIVRYIVHGCLHLLGHDDKVATARKRMKRAENKWVLDLASRFTLSRLQARSKLRP